MKKIILPTLLILSSLQVFSQTFSVVASNLRSPLGLSVDAANNLWLVETGSGQNDSRVSILKPDGSLLPVIKDLPSFFDTIVQEIQGPSHVVALPLNQIAVLSGGGKDVLSGSVLLYNLNGFTPGTSPTIAASSTSARVDITGFVKSKGFLESNPFSAALDGLTNLFVVDAAANSVIKLTLPDQKTIVATLPDFQNPTPVGPPFINQVPTRILAKPGGGFYLATLTGFPFIDGAATIYSMTADGVVMPFKTGMTLLTDLAIDPASGDLLALQLAHFDFAPMPGFQPNTAKITRIKADGSSKIVAENFGPAAGMAIDQQGNVYVSAPFFGQVLKFDKLVTATNSIDNRTFGLNLSPNPATDFISVGFEPKNGEKISVSMVNSSGQVVFSKPFLDKKIDVRGLAAGVYFLKITTENGATGAARFVKE